MSEGGEGLEMIIRGQRLQPFGYFFKVFLHHGRGTPREEVKDTCPVVLEEDAEGGGDIRVAELG